MNDKDLVQIKLAFAMIEIGEWLKNPNDNQDGGKALIHKLKEALDEFEKVFFKGCGNGK